VGKEASISQNGNTLNFTNEGGGRSSGKFLETTRVQATDWGNLTANIEDDGKKLVWGNGTVWVKKQ
jgi:hypothetical protein